MSFFLFFFFNDTATTEIYTLSLHDALPIYLVAADADHLTPAGVDREPAGGLAQRTDVVARARAVLHDARLTRERAADATPRPTETKERDPRLPCTGAGAPSPLRFGAVGHGSGSDRPVRRLIGAPTAPPLPCCAVTDRGFPARAARGPGRRSAQRPQPARREQAGDGLSSLHVPRRDEGA